MQRTVLTCAVLVVMAAVPAAADDDVLGCCMPDKWEGRQVTTTVYSFFGGTYATQLYSDVTYDAVNQREVLIVSEPNGNGRTQLYKHMAFYGENRSYTYYFDANTCIEHDEEGSFHKRCIPETNSRIVDDDVTLGTGDDTLDVSRVSFEINGVHYTTLVTEECIPISEISKQSFFFAHETEIHEFENIKLGIESEDVFTLPAACQSNKKRAIEKAPRDFMSLIRSPPPA